MEVNRGGPGWGIILRSAARADYDAIIALWTACGSHFSPQGRESRSMFEGQVLQFERCTLVAQDADRIVGVVLGTHDGRKGWINRLAVLPQYRRKGLGEDLVRACDAALRALGIDIVCALVEPHNLASANLFRKLGYGDDVPVIYFRKLSHPGA